MPMSMVSQECYVYTGAFAFFTILANFFVV